MHDRLVYIYIVFNQLFDDKILFESTNKNNCTQLSINRKFDKRDQTPSSYFKFYCWVVSTTFFEGHYCKQWNMMTSMSHDVNGNDVKNGNNIDVKTWWFDDGVKLI